MALAVSAMAQQSLWNNSQIVSPQVNPDGTVTFRIQAPKAIKVEVTGEFLAPTKLEIPNFGVFDVPGVAALTEGENGVWEYTTPEPVPGGFYNYNFQVDGLKMLDLNNMHVNRDVANLTSVLLIPGGIGDNFVVNSVPHGTVSKVWYPSEAGYNRRMTVYTPAGYENSKTKYPVVYILHGAGGDEDAWVTQGRATQILDNLIAKGQIKPMIAVFTNGNISQEAAPLEGSFSTGQPGMSAPKQMEGSFEKCFPEVVKYVDSHYRTIAKKTSRAICGLSMGGFHTLYLTINYPDMFNYSGMFSAAIGVSDPSVSPLYQNVDEKLATYFSKKPGLLWIAIGKTDFLYKANVEFRAKLDAAHYPYIYKETEGGHVWSNWRDYLVDYLQLIFK